MKVKRRRRSFCVYRNLKLRMEWSESYFFLLYLFSRSSSVLKMFPCIIREEVNSFSHSCLFLSGWSWPERFESFSLSSFILSLAFQFSSVSIQTQIQIQFLFFFSSLSDTKRFRRPRRRSSCSAWSSRQKKRKDEVGGSGSTIMEWRDRINKDRREITSHPHHTVKSDSVIPQYKYAQRYRKKEKEPKNQPVTIHHINANLLVYR